MGLARQLDQLSWQISPDLEQTLRQHQLSIDIIKTRARHLDQIHDRRAPLHITELKPGEQVTGRVIGTGLENETTDRRYLMIEGNDGRLHYIRQTPAIEKARGEDRLRIGETVTVSGKEFEKNGRRVTYVQVAEHGKGAVAVTMIAGCFLRRCAQLMVHLGVAHPLRQALLQFVDQPAGCETRRRIPSLQQLLHHLIRNPGFVDLNLRIDRYVQPRSFRYRPLDGGHGVGRTLTIVESSEVWLTLTRSLNFGLATVNP